MKQPSRTEMGQPERFDATDPLAVILIDHRGHLDLCDLLEEIADSLPNEISGASCHQAIRGLRDRVRNHHRFEDEHFFPLLRIRAAEEERVLLSLDRLSSEHRIDEGYVEEVLELLTAVVGGSFRGPPELAGYMLRGLFESLRRHIAFENEVLLPLAHRLLTTADRAQLIQELTRD
jgi:hemerythrin-like domain-containing protein